MHIEKILSSSTLTCPLVVVKDQVVKINSRLATTAILSRSVKFGIL